MGAKSKKRSKRKFLESQRRKSLMSRKNRINLNHDNETDKQENYKSLNEIGPSTAEQKPIESPLTVLDLDDQSVYTCRFDPSEDNISNTHSPVSPNTTGNIMCKQKQPRPKKEISKKKSTLKDNTNKKRKSDYDKENTSCQSDVNKRSNKKAKLSHLPKNTCKMDAEQTCPYEVEAYDDDADGYTKVTVTGRRIVNIQSFFDQLKDVAHHSSLFSCGFHCIEIVSECKKGLYSRLNLECTLCKKKFQIETTDRDINKNAVSGVMASGGGYAQLQQLTAAVDLPDIGTNAYAKIQDEISNEWETTAWTEMLKAGQAEREAAIKEHRVSKDGIAMIDVIVDGCWSKRSYQTNYAANSGCAAIIGRRTGKVLYMAVKNKYCCICQKNGNTPKEHLCYKNFEGSSTAMESTIIAEGFKRSIEMHNVIYQRFIADGDSSTYAKIIDSQVGGKRINYTQRRGYQTRCSGAVISFNTGKLLSTVIRNTHHKSPSTTLKKYDDKVCQKRDKNRKMIRKKRRRFNATKSTDLNYGENAEQPDKDPMTFNMDKEAFLKNLEKSDEERNRIQKQTILQSECGQWLELRRNLLTASNFGKVIKRRKNHSCRNMVKNMLYSKSLDNVSSIQHGRQHEAVALEQLRNLKSMEINKCGLFIDEKHNFLGATPDGISGNMVVEIKCPIAPFKTGDIDAVIDKNKMHFWKKKKSGEVTVNKKSDWFYQAQGQMHISKRPQCLLAVWYGDNKFKIEILEKDDDFWRTEMEPKLVSFYMDCLLPELVDPRHPRHKLIRDNEPTTNYKPTTSHQPPEFSLHISETPKKRSEKIMQPRQKNVASPRIEDTNPPTLHRIIDFSKL